MMVHGTAVGLGSNDRQSHVGFVLPQDAKQRPSSSPDRPYVVGRVSIGEDAPDEPHRFRAFRRRESYCGFFLIGLPDRWRLMEGLCATVDILELDVDRR